MKIPSIRRASLRRGLALALAAGVSLAPSPKARAAQVASVKVDAAGITPIILDQDGARLPLPTRRSGPVTLPAGSMPTYAAYPLRRFDSLTRDFPTVYSEGARAGKRTGPLHLDAIVQGKLDHELAKYGKSAVHTREGTYVVKPLAPVFGGVGSGGSSPARIWLANASPANSKTSTSTGSTTEAQAQALIPPATSTKAPISYGPNYLIRDLQNLFRLESGKFTNMNAQSLERLKRDLGLSQPKNVAKHPAVTSPPKTAAQVLDPVASGAGSPQPAPIPEPSTLAFFGLALGAWGLRRGLNAKRRKPA